MKYSLSYSVVCITAKIHFLKQFTTKGNLTSDVYTLFVLLQRYTFWSNSQLSTPYFIVFCVVCITAKIHFLKQFTTFCIKVRFHLRLFVLLQRYTFWSNSQLVIPFLNTCHSCLYYCKDTLFEAIHNLYVVEHSRRKLFVLLQRYTFWSNSQPSGREDINRACCLYYCKDTLFEAIHNIDTDYIHARKLFVLLQRYTFWSNSQR